MYKQEEEPRVRRKPGKKDEAAPPADVDLNLYD